ncbi:arylsulfotransferase family protein [Pelagibius sp.]|uniref:arylsulfotransferase family protein n=1 Tax=Pelagibius sp. TaxID=1931238 RepID=UPI0026148C18|nr:arylsulfotransferase family protein [Pelagibius sp.]
MASGSMAESAPGRRERREHRQGPELRPLPPPLIDRIALPAFVIALLFLSFLGGAMVILTNVFPAGPLSDAYRGGKALIDKTRASRDPLTSDFWMPERRPDQGVTIHDPASAFPGYTLYTSGHGSEAFLFSMEGRLIHSWQLPYSAIWSAEDSPIVEPQPDPFLYWRKAMMQPNGDLLALFVATGDTPWGYGLVKLDSESNVLWSYLGQTHHDLDIADDGRVYTLIHKMRRTTYEDFPQLTVPRLDDFVVVLSPDGEEEKRVSILDALVNSDYARLLHRVTWFNKHDFIHTNNIDYIDAEMAAVLPFAEEGQVLLSFRDIDSIAVLDLEQEKIVWALRGAWLGQHDPDVLPNGNILLFDNIGHFGQGGESRVIEIDPLTGEEVWVYAGSAEQPFESRVRAAQQRLPNGNTLITESTGGRLFEVTEDGRIVWEFINPIRARHPEDPDQVILPVVSWGQRIAADDLQPAFHEALQRKEEERSAQ